MAPPFRVRGKIKLRNYNPDDTGDADKSQIRRETQTLCRRIGELQQLLYANSSHCVIILLQGMDASGKDSTSRRVLEHVTPSGIQTANFKAPSAEERAHDFLWRVHHAVPRYGNIGIFNRSHYEDVLIVRVLNLAPKSVWKDRYAQINSFEKHLHANRVVLLKFFLHISKEEQAKRFNDRLHDPTKNWKFSVEDLRMREKWDEFQDAYQDAINRCSTSHSPWHIVPANHKWYRDFLVARTIVEALENLHMTWPKPAQDLSQFKVV